MYEVLVNLFADGVFLLESMVKISRRSRAEQMNDWMERVGRIGRDRTMAETRVMSALLVLVDQCRRRKDVRDGDEESSSDEGEEDSSDEGCSWCHDGVSEFRWRVGWGGTRADGTGCHC